MDPIEELELDRRKLTVFIGGPGYGESLLVALPGGDWWIVDGAGFGSGRRAQFTAKAVLERHWRASQRIAALLVTHPHADHAAGIVELLDDERFGPAVDHVGFVLDWAGRGEEAATTLGVEHRALDAIRARRGVFEDSAHRRVRTLLARLRSEWDAKRGLALWAGVEVPTGSSGLRARVVAPTREDIGRFFGELGARPSELLARANEMSAVLELELGRRRLLFGGDMPDTRSSAEVPSGWSAIARREERALTDHVALKVPHHGSREALPDVLVGADDRNDAGERTWAITPFNTGGKPLPSPDDEEGLDLLLRREPRVHLSALPRSWRRQKPIPESMQRAEVTRALVDSEAVAELRDLRAVYPAGRDRELRVDECLWAFTFDEDGQLEATHRGAAATTVLRD